MRREEIGAAIFGFALACGMFLVAHLAGSSLSSSTFYNVGANEIQWVSGVGLIAGLSMAAWARWHNRCGVNLCIRRGEHPVAGTVRKVCTHHHTREHHELVHALHWCENKFGWGDTHGV